MWRTSSDRVTISDRSSSTQFARNDAEKGSLAATFDLPVALSKICTTLRLGASEKIALIERPSALNTGIVGPVVEIEDVQTVVRRSTSIRCKRDGRATASLLRMPAVT